MERKPNKGVQGTLHKVSGPLTPDVGQENNWMKRITTIIAVSITIAMACRADTTNNNTTTIQTNTPTFTIQGKVAMPGTYPLLDGMTLTKAIATAGGFTRWAEPKVLVLRAKGGFPAEIKVYYHPTQTDGMDRATFNILEIERGNLMDPEIQNGDVIIVRPRMM